MSPVRQGTAPRWTAEEEERLWRSAFRLCVEGQSKEEVWVALSEEFGRGQSAVAGRVTLLGGYLVLRHQARTAPEAGPPSIKALSHWERSGRPPGRWRPIGEVGVDSARIAIIDPAYASLAEGVQSVGPIVNERGIRLGEVVATPGGDGLFPIEARVEDGELVEVRVRFR
jgi:hypothetical protein